MPYNDDTLATLQPNETNTGFVVPETRMKNADMTQNFVRRLIQNDDKRARKRAKVDGLVGGFPPYNGAALAKAGRADACNVNWGTAASYCETGSGAFYDLVSEAPSFFSFRTGWGIPEQRETWSNLASKFADVILAKTRTWDYQVQLSQWDMVLHSCGPLFFEDEYGILPRAVRCGELRVPEMTKSDTEYWEACELDVSYYPPELYDFIKNEGAAADRGWNVEYTKAVISNAMAPNEQRGVPQDWEFYQQQCKNNSLNYMYDDGRLSRVAFVFWKEFDGRITQAIVERDSTTGGPPSYGESDAAKKRWKNDGGAIQYLYIKVGKYASWSEVIHPMYFDHGNGGYHHSVGSLGVKMFSAMEYENRLLCRLADDAFSPKILFSPNSEAVKQKFELTTLGAYGVLPSGMTMQQTPVSGVMNDGIAFRELMKAQMQDRLSAYRGGAPDQKAGNPRTAKEMMMQAQAQGAINKTQFNRFYTQQDFLASEIWRRLTNKSSTDDRAKRFQKQCKEAGIPDECFEPDNIEHIGVTRVVGQGSAFMRRDAIQGVLGIAGSLPEDGRGNLIRDFIAANTGQPSVTRYYPDKPQSNVQSDQQAEALLWVSAAKTGISPIVTSTQNPVTYAATFLKAGVDALQSVQQGADPAEVLKFLHTIGPAIIAQLQRFSTDKTRKTVFDEIMKQWKQLAAATDQLQAVVEKKQKEAQQQQSKTQQAMSDDQLAQAKLQADVKLKSQKTMAQLQQSAAKHQQQLRHKEESAALDRQEKLQDLALERAKTGQKLALDDASTAAEIHRNRMKAFATAE